MLLIWIIGHAGLYSAKSTLMQIIGSSICSEVEIDKVSALMQVLLSNSQNYCVVSLTKLYSISGAAQCGGSDTGSPQFGGAGYCY